MYRQCCFSGLRFCVLFFLFATSATSQVTPQDTSVPNAFRFSSAEYYVPEDATNAVITVEFSPGHRGYYGWVNYTVQDGTATANQDYTLVSGSLSFSGVPSSSFTVPIKMDSLDEELETIRLILSPSPFDANAIITQGSATLNIVNVRPVPTLEIVAGTNGTLTISWNDDGTNPILEKSAASPAAKWSVVTAARTLANGCCSVTEVPSGAMAFYRLRGSQ